MSQAMLADETIIASAGLQCDLSFIEWTAMPIPARFTHFETLGAATQPHFFQRVMEIMEIIHLFDDFERTDLQTMLAEMTCYRIPAESPIIFEDEPGDFMMLLLNGSVEIVKKDGDGVYQQLGFAGPGKMLGDMSLIDDEPRSAGCIARSEVTVAVLDREGLSRILAESPGVGCKVLMVFLLMSNNRLRDISGRLARELGNQIDWM